MKNVQNYLFIFFLVIYGSAIQGQQLISSKEKSWKTHFGINAGFGISNYFENAIMNQVDFIPESKDMFTLEIAPRPEAHLGIFTEIEFAKKWSHRLSLNYTMRAIPAPVFHDLGTDPGNRYQQIYLNGLSLAGTWYYSIIDQFKIGLGVDHSHFLITKPLRQSDYGPYSQKFVMSGGFRTEFVWKKDARTDFMLIVSAQSGTQPKMQLDNISGLFMVSYKLIGKEIKLKKDIYRLDYSH